MSKSSVIAEHLFREQSGKMHSILINHFGFEQAGLIEDVIQDTFMAALKNWSKKGVPENPEGWLISVAKNKCINELKRRSRHGSLNYKFIETIELEAFEVLNNDEKVKREQLKVLFSCCSPLVSVKAQLMLTLKIVSGFGDREIAKALLMNPQAVRKAIYRTQNTLMSADVTGDFVTNSSELHYPDRLEAVLKALYLMFNEGYYTTSDDTILDEDISFEAIRLTSWLLELEHVEHGKIHALLALMLFNFARFKSRLNNTNNIIDIVHQDRSVWEQGLIQKGIFHQKKSRESSSVSRYHIESGIAAEHCISPTYKKTNWQHIVSLYTRLLAFDSSETIQINRAVAIAEMGDLIKSLELLKNIEENTSKNTSLLFGAIGWVHLRNNNSELAAEYYRCAMDTAQHKKEQEFYRLKLTHIL